MKDVAKQWPLILPALAAFGMYSLLRPEIRYLAPFFVIFWIGLFSSVRLPLPGEVNRIISPVLLAVSTMLCIFILFSSERETTLTVRDLIKGEKSSPHIHWQVANELKRMGIQEGDKVASIGWGIRAFWARLARVRIVAEIFDREAPDFWMANDSVKSEVIRALVKTGAKVIVADHFPNYVPANGWQKIGDTNYYAYLLNR